MMNRSWTEAHEIMNGILKVIFKYVSYLRNCIIQQTERLDKNNRKYIHFLESVCISSAELF